MKRTGDLFEDLSAELGCIYISDLRLPPYREIACQSLISGQFSGYPVSMWRDMLNYLDVESSAEVAGKINSELYMTRLFMKNIWSIRKPARYLVYRAGFDYWRII